MEELALSNHLLEYVNDQSVASFILRVLLGIMFLFQGYDKLFRVKLPGVVESYRFQLGKNSIPDIILVPVTYFTSIIEFVGGVLLILGLFKTAVLYLLGIDLLLVAVALSIIKPIWDTQMLFSRLIILITLLLMPDSWDVLSLDYVLF